MKRSFKVEKLPLETLLNLLIELYEKGIDYIDLSSNSDDPHQDKLIIMTKDSYFNPEFKNQNRPFDDEDEDEDEDPDTPPKLPPTITLTEEDINNLL